MSRKIKFRAWMPSKKIMIQDALFIGNVGYGEGSVVIDERTQGAELVWLQFTGLFDKNGVEIYEGDVLKYHPYHNLGHKGIKTIGAVKWGETGDSDDWAHSKHYEWVVDKDSLADIADSDYKEDEYCEVIGNIYQNPELLEGVSK